MGEEYTVWPDQLDFSADLSKDRAAPGLFFFFYPGAAGVQFRNQYAQAGSRRRSRSTPRLPSTNCRCRCRRTSRLASGAQQWVNDLPTTRTRSSSPTTARSIPACARAFMARSPMTRAVDQQRRGRGEGRHCEEGRDEGRDGKGQLQFGARRLQVRQQPLPIQSFYLQDVVKDAGGALVLKTVATIVKNSQDKFHEKCPMK